MPIDKPTGDHVSDYELIRREQARGKYQKAEKAREIYKQANMKPIDTNEGKRQRMAELKEQLLSPGKGKEIVGKLLEVALNDEHPGQMAAMKMCLDRMLPTAMFEEKKDGGRAAIQINITGIGGSSKVAIEGESSVVPDDEVEDGD